jgi:hypothetical protein
MPNENSASRQGWHLNSEECSSMARLPSGRMYSGPPYLVRRWELEDHLHDFLIDESDPTICAVVRRLLVLLH